MTYSELWGSAQQQLNKNPSWVRISATSRYLPESWQTKNIIQSPESLIVQFHLHGWGTRLKNKIFRVIEIVQVWCNSSKTKGKYHSRLFERYRDSRAVTVLWPSQLHLGNRENFLFIFHYDMKRLLKKVLKSKKQFLGSIHGLGPTTSTLRSTGPTDLMLSIPACDSESYGTTSAQVAAGVNVSVQLHPSHL